MRITRMRAVAAGVLGAALIAVAPPASAATTTTSTSPSASPTVEATTTTEPEAHLTSPETTETPSADESATPDPDVSATPTATDTPQTTADATASATATESASPTSTPTEGTGDPVLDGFLSLLPFKVPLDKEIDGIEDFEANPFVLTFKCGANGPDWTLQNTQDRAFGFGWFDTSLGAGISEIGPGETLTLDSHGGAVVAAPWDAETGYLLVTLPTVGVSDCEGTDPPAAVPAVLPIAAPAATTAVRTEPYYTG
ncbi:hypothetical protein Ga0074812_11143 [Parafrankia irregularis]|uniref:Uncharacterized protein n=1 Tax=Parafrankia irregularis TaxID=795642 RepID=A0A0S4QNJ0_9ACTN|nr:MULTISPECIES: hypothetical protein [Parafrankia]MBE3204238.1 hypothetical protein [Parafrankia sp. CH37]CUU57207.1 hypothetical protein Ga0074812_11143 [Parafrankia irregularis]